MERDTPARGSAFVAAGVLALHVIAAVAALSLLPLGFAATDLHFWSNELIPVVASLAVVAALIHTLVRRSAIALRALVAAAAGGWASAVVAGAILFPISMTFARLAIPVLVALLLLALARWARQRTAHSVAALAVGAVLGVLVIFAQRGPAPSTHPAGGTLLDVSGASDGATDELLVPCGTQQLAVAPLLTFLSRSPDRTWTVLSPDPPGSHRVATRHSETGPETRSAFTDDGQSTLAVRRDPGGVDIEAIASLSAPVYAHLTSFTSITIPFDATVSFGPTGATTFPIEPADYPSGRPIRLAYMDAEGAFHVALADDAEKGPFRELAAGRLGRGEPLVLELHARNSGCRLTFLDWSSQASTEASPTAGWGVPQGSIQFFSRGSGLVLLTLADTGPGRGFDSVGHAAGTYRNRIRIEAIR